MAAPQVQYVMSEVEAAGFTPLRNFYKNRLVRAALEKGADLESIEKAIAHLESDRPLVDWFINGGFQQILKMIMDLILMFKEVQ